MVLKGRKEEEKTEKIMTEKDFYEILKAKGDEGAVMRKFYDTVLVKETTGTKEQKSDKLASQRAYIAKELGVKNDSERLLDAFGKNKDWKDEVAAFREALKPKEELKEEKKALTPKKTFAPYSEKDAKEFLSQHEENLDEAERGKLMEFYSKIPKKGFDVKEIFEARVEEYATSEGTRGVDRPFSSESGRKPVMDAWNATFPERKLSAVPGRNGKFGYTLEKAEKAKKEEEAEKPAEAQKAAEAASLKPKELEDLTRKFYKDNKERIHDGISEEDVVEAAKGRKMTQGEAEDFLGGFVKQDAAKEEKKSEKAEIKQIPKNEKRVIEGKETTMDEYLTNKIKEISEQVNADPALQDGVQKWERERKFSYWDLLIIPAIWKYGISYLTDAVGLTGGKDAKIDNSAKRNEAIRERVEAEMRRTLGPMGIEYKDGNFYEKEGAAPAAKEETVS